MTMSVILSENRDPLFGVMLEKGIFYLVSP
jgi:hypothetical protein